MYVAMISLCCPADCLTRTCSKSSEVRDDGCPVVPYLAQSMAAYVEPFCKYDAQYNQALPPHLTVLLSDTSGCCVTPLIFVHNGLISIKPIATHKTAPYRPDTTLLRAHILVRQIRSMSEQAPHSSTPTVIRVIDVNRSHLALGLDHSSVLYRRQRLCGGLPNI